MVSRFHSPAARDVGALLAPLRALAAQSDRLSVQVVGRIKARSGVHELVRFQFKGPVAAHDPIRLGIFAGVHGDEPAGCAAVVQFLTALVAEPERATGYDISAYPVINPTGYAAGTRENETGLDLNREFWRQSAATEVPVVEAELRAGRFDGLITLHADDTCEGLYGYSHGRTLEELLLKPALVAGECALPRDRRGIIDGFVARDGVICDCFTGILSAPPEQTPQPFNLIFETPAHAPIADQIAASVAALDTIVASYRGFIAHAQYL